MFVGKDFFVSFLANKIYGTSVRLDKERCASWNMHCDKPCEAGCPHGAVTGEKSLLDPEKCCSCGSCTVLCPVGAVSFINLDDTVLINTTLDSIQNASCLKFVCDNSEHIGKSIDKGFRKIKVSCLARLYSAMLLIPAAMGVKAVWLDTSACSTCKDNKNQILTSLIEKNREGALSWLEVLRHNSTNIYSGSNYKHHIDFEQFDIDNLWEGFNRRELFGYINSKFRNESISLINELRVNIWENMKYYYENKKVEKNLPLKNHLTMLVLGSFSNEEKILSQELPDHLMLDIGEGCSFCSICSSICPTGAIEKRREGQKGVLKFNLSFCIGCRVCQKKCSNEVISFKERAALNDLLSNVYVTIKKVKLSSCKRCKGIFVSHLGSNSLCPICYEKDIKRDSICI